MDEHRIKGNATNSQTLVVHLEDSSATKEFDWIV